MKRDGQWVLYSEQFGEPMYIATDGTATDQFDQAEIYDEHTNREVAERCFTRAAGYAWRAVDLVNLKDGKVVQ